jgi:mevalonate kinase
LTFSRSFKAIKAGMDSVEVRKKIEDDERKIKRQAYDDTMTAMNTKITNENEDFVQNQHKVTRQLIKDQDQSLEHLGGAVDRLGEYGREINTEIKSQGKMLDSLGNEIDVASEKMNTVQAALSKLLNTKDSCQIWTVVILAVILIILVALVIWT